MYKRQSQLLELCCADAVAAADDGTARGREARQRCWAEVKHLPLIPLEDGTVAACRPRRRVFDGPTTTTGAPLLATPRQSALCPGLARRVVRLRAAKAAPAKDAKKPSSKPSVRKPSSARSGWCCFAFTKRSSTYNSVVTLEMRFLKRLLK